MQFSTIAVLLTAAAASVVAAPNPPAAVCDSGSQYCGTNWTLLSETTCASGSVYCCNTKAAVALITCTNVLSGNTILVPVNAFIPIIL